MSEQRLPFSHIAISSQIKEFFDPMCVELSLSEACALSEKVQSHLKQFRLALQVNEFLDIELAEQVAEVLTTLLRGYTELTSEQRSLVVGAARYFITSQDAEGDFTSILGCEDDAQVLNYVLALIGKDNLMVGIHE